MSVLNLDVFLCSLSSQIELVLISKTQCLSTNYFIEMLEP